MNGSKVTRIVGWVLSVLIATLLIGASAPAKLFPSEKGKADFKELGFNPDVMFKIGIVEAAIAVLFLIPRTSFVAAILLAGYLGGATATHVRLEQPVFFAPIVFGIVAWIALGLRNPAVFRLACGCGAKCAPPSAQA